MGVIEGLLGALPIIGNIFSASETNATNREINEEQMKFNAQQAQLSRDWSEKMWNLSNQYSSPVQSMQRLADAGLNPHLVYGSGADTTAASVPAGQSANAGSLRAMENPRYGDMMIQLMQMRNLKAQTKNLETENKVKEETARGQKIQNDILEATKEDQIAIKQNENISTRLRNNILESEAFQNYLKNDLVKVELDTAQKNYEYLVTEKDLSIQEASARIDQIKRTTDAQVKMMHSQEVLNYANAQEAHVNAAIKKIELKFANIANKAQVLGALVDVRKASIEARNLVKQGKVLDAKKVLTDAQTRAANAAKEFTKKKTDNYVTDQIIQTFLPISTIANSMRSSAESALDDLSAE